MAGPPGDPPGLSPFPVFLSSRMDSFRRVVRPAGTARLEPRPPWVDRRARFPRSLRTAGTGERGEGQGSLGSHWDACALRLRARDGRPHRAAPTGARHGRQVNDPPTRLPTYSSTDYCLQFTVFGLRSKPYVPTASGFLFTFYHSPHPPRLPPRAPPRQGRRPARCTRPAPRKACEGRRGRRTPGVSRSTRATRASPT